MEKVSMAKVNAIRRDIKDWNICNINTWETLDIFREPRELSNTHKNRNYKQYYIINKTQDMKKELFDKLWPTKFAYLMLMILNIGYDNSVDYNLIPIKGSTVKHFKWILKKLNIVKRAKFEGMSKVKYFLNPEVSTYSDTYKQELDLLFANPE